MFIVCFDEEMRRLQPGEPGSSKQRGHPKDQEWRYEAVNHLRLAQVESTELGDGSYVILPNTDGKFEMTFFVEDPSDQAKSLEEKRFLYELHRSSTNDSEYFGKVELHRSSTNGSEYFGEVEPSHRFYGPGVKTYTLPLDFGRDEYRIDDKRVAIGPFSFSGDNPDEWIIPSEMLQELKEVQEATGLSFGPPSKKLAQKNKTRKRSRSSTRSGPKSTKSGRKERQRLMDGATEGYLSNYDRKVANQMLENLATSFNSAQTGSRAMNQCVHAAAHIVEVDENGFKSILLRVESEYSRKGGNETHAEQHLLNDLYGRLLPKLKEKRHHYAKQYMILMVAHNMERDGIGMDGSLCGDCVCALYKFQRRCGLNPSMLKVITPRMEREDETGDLRSISAVAKIQKRWDKSHFTQKVTFADVDYVPCFMNGCSSAAESNPSDQNHKINTVEKLIQDECKRRKRRKKKRKHMQCCHCAEDEKHVFEI